MKVVLKPLDVILAKIIAGLHFDDFKRLVMHIGEAVNRARWNIS